MCQQQLVADSFFRTPFSGHNSETARRMINPHLYSVQLLLLRRYTAACGLEGNPIVAESWATSPGFPANATCSRLPRNGFGDNFIHLCTGTVTDESAAVPSSTSIYEATKVLPWAIFFSGNSSKTASRMPNLLLYFVPLLLLQRYTAACGLKHNPIIVENWAVLLRFPANVTCSRIPWKWC